MSEIEKGTRWKMSPIHDWTAIFLKRMKIGGYDQIVGYISNEDRRRISYWHYDDFVLCYKQVQ